MPKFTIRLTDDEAVQLDAIRARAGFRSEADVIRHWISRHGEPQDNFAAELAARPYRDEYPRVIDHGTQVTVGPMSPHMKDESYRFRVDKPYEHEHAVGECPNGARCHTPADCQARGHCGGKLVEKVTVEAVEAFIERQYEADHGPAEIDVVVPAKPGFQKNESFPLEVTSKPVPRSGVTSIRFRTPKKRQRPQRGHAGFPG